MEYYQTGDVLYKKQSTLPTGLKKIRGSLVHKGDNHSHRIEGDFSLHEGEEGFFIKTNKVCKLTHEEHKTIKLPKGIYKKDIVLEYDHFLEESRQVVD